MSNSIFKPDKINIHVFVRLYWFRKKNVLRINPSRNHSLTKLQGTTTILWILPAAISQPLDSSDVNSPSSKSLKKRLSVVETSSTWCSNSLRRTLRASRWNLSHSAATREFTPLLRYIPSEVKPKKNKTITHKKHIVRSTGHVDTIREWTRCYNTDYLKKNLVPSSW